MRSLVRLLAQNAAVLVSTHILQEVQAVCDRVLILRKGRLVLDSRLDALGGTDRLLVTTDAEPAPARALLEGISGVAQLEALGGQSGGQRYAVIADADAGALAPDVARAIHEAGHALYSLEADSRDLEAVYAEVNAAAA